MNEDEKSLVTQEKELEKTVTDVAVGDLDELLSPYVMHMFVCDVSASMGEKITWVDKCPKIKLLRRAVELYATKHYEKNRERQGEDVSRLGLITFSDYAELLVPLTKNVQEVIDMVKCMEPISSTNMADGLELALAHLNDQGAAALGWIPRIILISDGEASNPQRVYDVIKKHEDQLVVIDAVYIGPNDGGYKSTHLRFMERLAVSTEGVFEIISSEEEFEQKFLKLLERKLLSVGTLQIKEVL